jgi:hypothetical protein
MANEDHLARLKQGVGAWNQWRVANPTITPDLSTADLTGADLAQANLYEADLRGAHLTGVLIEYSVFGDVDLSTVQGLDTIEHRGPSSIDIDTLYRSQGKIPEAFLRDPGVPEDMITYIKSLVGRPFEFYSCFIGSATQVMLPLSRGCRGR